MITETFLNLNEEKQTKIYQALFNEYCQFPLEEVSVKNIVTKANIPRGSFYQYFTNKEGALIYLIKKNQQTDENFFEDINSLSIYKLIESIFYNEINNIKSHQKSDRLLLLKQIVKSTKATSIFYNVLKDEFLNNTVFEICWNNTASHIDSIDIKISTLDLLFSTFKESLVLAIEDDSNVDDSIRKFNIKVNIIKNGINNINI